MAGLAAVEEGQAAAKEQYDVLLDKGRDLVDSAADLIRERPIAAFGTAFAAGWMLRSIHGKKGRVQMAALADQLDRQGVFQALKSR